MNLQEVTDTFVSNVTKYVQEKETILDNKVKEFDHLKELQKTLDTREQELRKEQNLLKREQELLSEKQSKLELKEADLNKKIQKVNDLMQL
jgi:chromosome segregation ATPase